MKIKIILLICVVCVIVMVGWFLLKKTPQEQVNVLENQNNIDLIEKKQIKNEQKQDSFKKPTEKILVFQTNKGEVNVNNFYTNASFVDSEGNAEILWTEDYALHYLFEEKKFAIYIAAINVDETQKKAENDLLRILNITKSDACKLGVFFFIDKEYDTRRLGRQPLSFCPN